MAKKNPSKHKINILPSERIESKILLIRDQKVLLDEDLAEMYEVDTKSLTRAVRRNIERFPSDFMFRLTAEEFSDLRRQYGASRSWGGRRYAPYAFSEQGVAMLSSVLRSNRAIEVNIQIMRSFVKLRELLATHKDLAAKISTLEKKYDQQFQVVFDAIRKLLEPSPPKRKRRIGFAADDAE